MKIDLNKPEYYVNRELSWLKFNLRVLREAGVRNLPLLERLRFVAISASNLDEFFMVRVAGLIEQKAAGVDHVDAAGLNVEDQLRNIALSAHNQMKLKYRYFFALVNELEKYEQRLIDEWEHAFAAMEDDLAEYSGVTEEEKIKEGRRLFSEIEKKDIRIRPKCQEAFVMRGSYHMLANQLKVGWHIDFYDRLKRLLDT